MSVAEEIKKTEAPKKLDETPSHDSGPQRKQSRIALLEAIEPSMIAADRVRVTMSRSSLEDLKGEASMTTYVMRYIADERLDHFIASAVPGSIKMQDDYRYAQGDIMFLVSCDKSSPPSEENCNLLLAELVILG